MKSQTSVQAKQSRVNPLKVIKTGPKRARRMEFKVGNLFYDYISNTSLMDREDRISGSDVAEILEEAESLKTRFRSRFGKSERVRGIQKDTSDKNSNFIKDALIKLPSTLAVGKIINVDFRAE